MAEPLISDTALWASCAHAVAELVQRIARDDVLPRWHALRVDTKADGSLLSDADSAVQHRLAEALPSIYPAPLLGEESPVEAQDALWRDARNAQTTLWIADPIDGTTNFVTGLPWYAISVALVHQGKTVVGVTYAPALNNLWHASLGGGAFFNDQRLNLSPTTRPLKACLVGIDMTYLPPALRLTIANVSPSGLTRTTDQTAPWRGWRSLGASTLEWCALACGQIQAYLHGGQMPWDAAAGRLILAEAGGDSAALNDAAATAHLQPTAYAAAAPGVWPEWQAWLREQQMYNHT